MRFSAAIGAGAQIGITKNPIGMRGTLVGLDPSSASTLSIERQPTLHGLRLSGPHEQGILTTIRALFDHRWKYCAKTRAKKPKIEALKVDFIAQTLKKSIPAYANASVSRSMVLPSQVKLLTKNIERFKLFRISVLEEMRAKHNLPEMGKIIGSPWPYILPIVERRPNGAVVVIDGAHRVWHSLRRPNVKIPILLVEGVTAELPAQPLSTFDEVQVTFQKWSRFERYNNYDNNLFRPIHDAIQRELWKNIDQKPLKKIGF